MPTAITSYTKSPYFFTMSISVPSQTGDSYIIQGIADLTIDWTKPVRYYKNLDDNYVQLVYGKSEGRITLRGFATTSQIATVLATSDDYYTGGTMPSEWTAATELKVIAKSSKSDAGTTAKYTGFNTGGGFSFRQVEERIWVLDGIKIFEIFE